MKQRYRIWKGKKEGHENFYYCGQVFVTEGRLKGCAKTVTSEYPTKEQAEQALYEYLNLNSGTTTYNNQPLNADG